MTPRRNDVAVIAFAPRIIGHLQVPITAAQQAILDDIEMRTGVTAQQLVLSLLDDALFDITAACAEKIARASARADISSGSSAGTDEASAFGDKPSIGGSHE